MKCDRFTLVFTEIHHSYHFLKRFYRQKDYENIRKLEQIWKCALNHKQKTFKNKLKSQKSWATSHL